MHVHSAMYQNHFRLTAAPFSIAPDPRFLYLSEKHREALAHLTFGIKNGGFVLLTGEVGTGKTTLCRCLLEQVPETCDVAFIYNPKLSAIDLLQTICDEFRIRYIKSRKTVKYLIDLINKNLLSTHAKGRNPILIIDEAQNLSVDVLEQLRLLTNLETSEKKLLQIVMIGQPELQEMLNGPHLRQFAQRITARYHLRPLSKNEVVEYVAHRLAVAGDGATLFSHSALRRLYRLSGGIPRLINVICDRALLGAYARDERSITAATISTAAQEVFGRPIGVPARMRRVGAAVLVGSLLLVFAAVSIAVLRPNTLDWVDRLARDDMWDDSTATFVSALRAKFGFDAPATNEAPSGEGAEFAVSARIVPSIGARLLPDPPTTGEIGDLVSLVALDDAEVPLREEPNAVASNETEVLPPDELGSTEGAVAPDDGPYAALSLTALPAPSGAVAALPEDRIESTGDAFPTWLQAYDALLARWNMPLSMGEGPPCEHAELYGLGCFKSRGDLAELRRFNRPAVLRLVDRHGAQFYVALTSLAGDEATIVSGGSAQVILTEELEAVWSGDFSVLWRMPPGYEQPIIEGDEGPVVDWLYQSLARVQGRDMEPTTKARYDGALVDQVIQYQTNKGLDERGVIGPQTLIALDADVHSDGPMLTDGSEAD